MAKRCRKCGIEKAHQDFHKSTKAKDGLVCYCKVCIKADRDQKKDQMSAYAKQYYLKNKDKRTAQIHDWYENNKAQVSEVKKRRYQTKRVQHQQLVRKWSAAHPERRREIAKAWKQRNPQQNRIACNRRRAKTYGSRSNLRRTEWMKLCDWFGNICLKCGTPDGVTIDHVMPLSTGGSDTIENLQPLCKRCNTSKYNKTIDYRDPKRLAEFLEAQNGV